MSRDPSSNAKSPSAETINVSLPPGTSDTSRVRELTLWCGLSFFYGVLGLVGLMTSFNDIGANWILVSRFALSLMSSSAAIAILAGYRLPEAAATAFLFCALGVQSSHAILEGPQHSTFLQLTGVVFVVTVAVFRSTKRDWLLLFLPLCTALLYVPAFLKKDLAGSLVTATAALVFGQIITWIKNQRLSVEKLSCDLSAALEHQQLLMTELKRLSFSNAAFAGDAPPDQAGPNSTPVVSISADAETMQKEKPFAEPVIEEVTLKTVTSEQPAVAPVVENQTSLNTIVDLMSEILVNKRAEYIESQKIKVSWIRSAERNPLVAVQIHREDFINIISSLIDQCAASIGWGGGVVHLGINTSQKKIQITIEDNGRGISVELSNRIQLRNASHTFNDTNHLTFAQMKSLVGFWGGRIERQSRLGVGSRVDIELPRIDASSREIDTRSATESVPDRHPEPSGLPL